MKTEISRDSHQPEKHYSGVYQQQGRMLTDADWNELVDILKDRLDDALKDIVGSSKGSIGGTPHHRALKAIKASSGAPLAIKSGYVYVDGVSAQAMPDPAKYTGSPPPEIFEYDKQLDFPSPPALPTSGNYILYADVWERTVTQLMDVRLRDKGLHGADTCTRKQVMAQIKWCPETIEPEKDEQKNPHRGDAKATIKLLQKSTQPDPCDPCAEKLEVESRVGNYLFRIEVHDVKGPADAPTEITLKWSGENGAIQFPLLKDGQGNDIPPPAHFTAGGWAYEFFDETSERHLGVHHALAWLPVRSGLVNVYSQPAAAPKQNVRRWDGYCTLQKSGSSWSIGEQYDKDFKESSFASLNGSQLAIKLPAQEIVIKFGQAIVAGDYWLAEVREAEHEPGAELITNALPCGIGHRYLKLGKVAGGVLQANPEADRKYAFPPLTEMTRMFIAGGDGQEAMPGHMLPNPIRVGVANGEWPVTGAKVRFTLESGNGVLSLSGAPSFSPEALPLVVAAVNGLAICYWKVGDGIAPHSKLQRVKAELLGTDGNPIAHPPLFFNANLSTADEVAYTPQCMPDANAATVHHLLLGPDLSRLGADGYYTVKEVLDALLCELKAGHIPYDEPVCAVTPSVKSLLSVLDINSDGHITVKDVLDTLLCKLRANHIPFYPEDCASGVLLPTVKTGLNINNNTNVHEVLQKLICKLDASIIPYNPGIRGSRWDDVNAEEGVSRPSTVQQAIDDLVDNLQSEDIKYTPSCVGDTPATVRSMLAIPTDTTSRVHEILNKLLCMLDAAHLPLDKTDAGLCADFSAAQSVQDALKILCNRKPGGGCCTIVISPGDDLAAKLAKLSNSGLDAHVCITSGEYNVKEPVIIDGCGHIMIQGCGDGSLINAPNSESALILSKCKSVVVRDLSMRSGRLGSKGTGYDHLNGALAIHDVEKVVVENVTLACAEGDSKMGSCLTVAHSVQTSSIRIRGCRLNPGDWQVGVLLVNADRACVEDNEVKVRPRSRKRSFKDRLRSKGFRLSIRKLMLSDVVVVDKAAPPLDMKGGNVVEIPYENGMIIRFKTPVELSQLWEAYWKKFPPVDGLNGRELIRYLKDAADRIIVNLGAKKERIIHPEKMAIAYPSDKQGGNNFLAWIEKLKQHLPATASQGIVCAGRIANDITISGNSIVGVAQGVHIGLSHGKPEGGKPDIAGRLTVSGNRVVNYLSSLVQMRGEWHGLFAGNFECLYIENNHLKLEIYPYTLDVQAQGIRLYGFFGGMLQVRGNRLNGYSTGIFAKAVNSSEELALWQVENNLLAGGSVAPVLLPQDKFIAANNPS